MIVQRIQINVCGAALHATIQMGRVLFVMHMVHPMHVSRRTFHACGAPLHAGLVCAAIPTRLKVIACQHQAVHGVSTRALAKPHLVTHATKAQCDPNARAYCVDGVQDRKSVV